MIMYKQYRNGMGEIANGVIRTLDGAFIPMDEDNTDYQAYLEWVAEGNQPQEAE